MVCLKFLMAKSNLKLIVNNTVKKEDFKLIEETLKGDFIAFEELYRKYEQMVAGMVYPYLNNRSLLDDIMQDIFLKVYKALPKFKKKSSFKTWLFRIVINHAKNLNRTKKSRQKEYELNDNILTEDRAYYNPEKKAYSDMIGEKINETVNKLGAENQSLFRLRYIDEFSIGDISGIMNLAAGTIKSRLFYIRKFMKKELQYLYKESK